MTMDKLGFSTVGDMFIQQTIPFEDFLPFVTSVVVLYRIFGDQKSKIRYYFCYVVSVGICALFGIIIAPLLLLRPRNLYNCWYSAEVLKHIDKVVGISWEVRNGHILAEDRGAVICANHQSLFDILGMFQLWGLMKKCLPVAKKEMMYWFPTMWLAGVLFINRKETRSAMESMERASKVIHENQTKLWIFPEGTRNMQGGELLPFKRGAFKIAIECQAPIIPLVYSPYYFINGSKKFFRKGKVIVSVLDPIPTKGLSMDDLDSLMKRCYESMSSTYAALCQEVQSFK